METVGKAAVNLGTKVTQKIALKNQGNQVRGVAGGADDVMTYPKLKRDLLLQKNVAEHSYIKHASEFPEINSQSEFLNYARQIIDNPVEVKIVSGGKIAY